MDISIVLMLRCDHRYMRTPKMKNATDSQSIVVSGRIGIILAVSCRSFISGCPLTKITAPPL